MEGKLQDKKSNVDFGFIVFDSEQVDEIAKKVGLHFNNQGYLKKASKSIKCNCCGHPIRKKNLGNILPGSNVVYCDNPVCFAEYIDEHLNL